MQLLWRDCFLARELTRDGRLASFFLRTAQPRRVRQSAFSSIDIAMGRRVGLGLEFVSESVFDDDSENLISYQV